MPLPKPRKDLKIAILVPCYKRPEYTIKCIQALEEAQEYNNVLFVLWDDGSNDETENILRKFKYLDYTVPQVGPEWHLARKMVCSSKENNGLRYIINAFITDPCKDRRWGIDIMGKMENDCKVPKNWLNDLLDIFEKSDVQILSPNVYPSNAAYVHGRKVEGLPYMPSKIVGGLWFMWVDLIKGMNFERYDVRGTTGAFSILKQILMEKNPKVGWAPDIMVQDMGHWSGTHPEHIKSPEHLEYYQEMGRKLGYA